MIRGNPASQPAVFLDRDGVLNEDRDYAYRPEDLKILPGVADALKKLKQSGFLLIVISNQSGVARGYFQTSDVERFNNQLKVELERDGATIDDFFFCPHYPGARVPRYAVDCACRKPGIGLIQAAQAKHPIDLPKSYLVGDKDSDIACALNAGIKGIQVDQGKTPVHEGALAVVRDLSEATAVILRSSAFVSR